MCVCVCVCVSGCMGVCAFSGLGRGDTYKPTYVCESVVSVWFHSFRCSFWRATLYIHIHPHIYMGMCEYP